MLAATGAVLSVSVAAPLLAASVAPAQPALMLDNGHVRVVVIAVPDLRWSDLAFMPQLRAFARTAAAGDLSVKTVGMRADCSDGLLTFNAGNRVDSRTTGCRMSAAEFETARSHAAGSAFDADVGALGHALRSSGFATEALNLDAVPMLADQAGQVTRRPDRTGAVNATLPAVDAVVDTGLYDVPAGQRPVAAGLVDGQIHDQVAELLPSTTVVVAGLSDAATGDAHLHVLLVRHQGWGRVELARPSTRPPYVALIDLAPTLLHLLGREPPPDMAGRVLHPTSTPARSWTAYADQDRHARAALSTSKPLRYTLAIAALVVIVLLLLAGRAPGSAAASGGALWLARLVVGVPLFAFLVQLLPWWRQGGVTVAAMFAGAAVAFAVVVAVAARLALEPALLAVPAVTFVALLADQLAGAPLQLSSPLGDNPLIGGRFHGMGNIDFALFATSALLCAGLAGGALVGRGRRRPGVAVAAAIGGLALVVDGAPPLGDDAGGAVTLLTAVAALLAVLAGVRISWRRGLVVLVAAVLVVLLVGVADHARGSDVQTHLGRFVGQLLTGGGGVDVRRRLVAVGRSFGNVPITLLVAAAAAAVIGGRTALRHRSVLVPGLPAALAGVATVLVLGSLLNDSGVVVAGFVLILALGAVVGAGLFAVAPDEPAPDRAG